MIVAPKSGKQGATIFANGGRNGRSEAKVAVVAVWNQAGDAHRLFGCLLASLFMMSSSDRCLDLAIRTMIGMLDEHDSQRP